MTQANVVLDGDFSDWAPVLTDAQNVTADLMGASDPDNPPQGDRDFTQIASTWNGSDLFFYFRRSIAGNRAVQYIAYLDLDDDGFMETGEPVAYWGFNGDAFQSSKSGLARYIASGSGGDVLLGDGYTMPGFLGAALPAQMAGAGGGAGIEFECSIPWASLGVAAGAPLGVHFSAANTMNLPSGVTDNAGAPWSTAFRGLTFQPDRTGSGAAGAVVSYSHTLTNTGNTSDTYELTAASASGWSQQVLVNGAAASAVTLAAGESATITLRTTIPASAANGSRDTATLTARSRTDSTVAASVRDTTYVGSLTLVADSSASMAPGQVVRYVHTLSNNGSTVGTFSVSAASNNGWPTTVYAADGSTVQSAFRIGAGQSTTFVVAVSVPAAAVLGTQDTVTVLAAKQGDAAVTARVLDVTTVRAGLLVDPDSEQSAGANTTVKYLHTVTNSWPTTRTIDLSALSSAGWTTRIYDADGTTPITSVVVGPNGATRTVFVHVSVPGTAAEGTSDVTTLTGRTGAVSDTAVDRTTIARLGTYSDGSYSTAADSYAVGDTAYARGMGLAGYSDVRFRWLDPTGAIVYTSPRVGVDVQGVAPSTYTFSPSDPVGTWTLLLLNGSSDTEIARKSLAVVYKGKFTELFATDAASIGSTATIGSTVRNHGSAAIADSYVRYLIWWDSDSSGLFDSGDLYIDGSGDPQTYSGTGSPTTRLVSSVSVAANASWSDPGWSTSTEKFPNSGTWRITAWWETSGGLAIDTRTTTFFAVPALGWPLTGVTVVAGVALLYRRFRRLVPGDRA